MSILLATATGAFGGQLIFGVGTAPRSIATADVDGDGKLDLVVGSESLPGVSILLNDGTGHFPGYRKLVLGASPTAVGAADFDGDGHTDIAVAMTGSGVTVLWGTAP